MATIASLVRERVSLQVNSVGSDLPGWVCPKLQSEGMVVRFLLIGGSDPSPAALGKIGEGYVRAIERFAEAEPGSGRAFQAGESKEDVARPYMERRSAMVASGS